MWGIWRWWTRTHWIPRVTRIVWLQLRSSTTFEFEENRDDALNIRAHEICSISFQSRNDIRCSPYWYLREYACDIYCKLTVRGVVFTETFGAAARATYVRRTHTRRTHRHEWETPFRDFFAVRSRERSVGDPPPSGKAPAMLILRQGVIKTRSTNEHKTLDFGAVTQPQ